jgi:SAM-dependent methyltransferase
MFFYKKLVKNIIEKLAPRNFCPFCEKHIAFQRFGTEERPARCPLCGSLERHRFLFYLYPDLIRDKIKSGARVLHFAPERPIAKLLQRFGAKDDNYVGADLNPERYAWFPNIRKIDGMNTGFADKTFDIILHNQVMEHVPDDIGFIRENLRILNDDGVIIVNLPHARYLSHGLYQELPTAAERKKEYKQDDHVRLYGRDFADRFKDLDCDVTVVCEEDLLNPYELEIMGIKSCMTLSNGYMIIRKK